MNLKESIRRILREEYTDKQKKLLTLASQIGFLKTADMVGGVDDLLNILGNDFLNNKNNKIMIIKEVVESTDDEYITLMDMNESSIVVKDEDGEISQIEMIHPNDVTISHYGGYGYSQDLGETYIDYYTLPKDILDDIFNMVMGYYIENN
jgi:hypothetical protein